MCTLRSNQPRDFYHRKRGGDRMRELNFVGPGKLEWREVAAPKIDGPGQALVRPIAVATCDLDALLIRGEAPLFGGGFPFGHESVGVVVEVGDEVTAFKPGD